MSDSKGAAIEKLLEKLTVKTGEEYHRLHSGKLSFEIADSRMRYYEKEAAEAILAILAQEVKRAHEQGIADGIESCINSGHIFKVAEKPPQRERLG